MAPKREAPVKGWVATINNWEEPQRKALLEAEADYVVVGKEVGKQGTPHLQVYISFRHLVCLTSKDQVNDSA